MKQYKPTIGLEIHAEMKTNTKMFCDSRNDLEEKNPNVNVCPVCMAHPGTLPVINKKAVENVLRVGVAVSGALADFTEFDRKNYFYPDIPKGYQISQFKYPLVKGGSLNGVAITRIHLEEDTARSIHTGDSSLIDFNRAGVPLMELVTEPVIHSAEEAGAFARELQLLLRYLGVSDADMEKGHMRVEANISVGTGEVLGTKTEVKNLNSFKNAEKAIDYEIKRHIEVLEGGGEVIQETRGWDEAKQSTFPQRVKETSEDYRYFPEPDLPKLKISEIAEWSVGALQKTLPELPWEKRERFIKSGIKEEDANMYVADESLASFVEIVATLLKNDKAGVTLASNYITSDIAGALKKDNRKIENTKLNPENFSELITMALEGSLSSRGVKDAIVFLMQEGGSAQSVVEKHNLSQKSSEEALGHIVKKIMENNASVVADYKSGKEEALQFLVGQGMKETKGSANPQVLKKLIQENI